MPKLRPVERKIREGTLVKVRSYEAGREKIKGRLDILNDSTISVGTNMVLINDIERISARTTFSKVSGPVISGAGITGTIFMTPVFIESLSLIGEEAVMALVGFFLVPMAAAALIGSVVAAAMERINNVIFSPDDTRVAYVRDFNDIFLIKL